MEDEFARMENWGFSSRNPERESGTNTPPFHSNRQEVFTRGWTRTRG
jgi:hypothetical protein